MRQTLHNLADIRVGLVRLDSGFYDKKILNFLEDKGLNYIISAKFYTSIKRLAVQKHQWIELSEGVEVCSVNYKAKDWSEARRFVLVRQRIKDRPKATGKLLRLAFEEYDSADYKDYRYSAFVTNLTLPAAEIWRLYRGRAEIENRIKELAYDFGVKSFNLHEFRATEASLNFVMLAYNLMNLFRRFIMRQEVQSRLSTLRYTTFSIGAYIEKRDDEVVLTLALKHPRRQWFIGLWANSLRASPPFYKK